MKCNSSPSKEDDQGILLIKKSQIIVRNIHFILSNTCILFDIFLVLY